MAWFFSLVLENSSPLYLQIFFFFPIITLFLPLAFQLHILNLSSVPTSFSCSTEKHNQYHIDIQADLF